MKLFNAIRRPWAAWVAMLVILCGTTAVATSPSLWARWVVADASATPSPVPTGFAGPVVVAQATNAPTPQPGNVRVTGSVQGGGTILGANAQFSGTVQSIAAGSATLSYDPPVYTNAGGAAGSGAQFVLFSGSFDPAVCTSPCTVTPSGIPNPVNGCTFTLSNYGNGTNESKSLTVTNVAYAPTASTVGKFVQPTQNWIVTFTFTHIGAVTVSYSGYCLAGA